MRITERLLDLGYVALMVKTEGTAKNARFAAWVHSAIAYYISSGRAGSPFLAAFVSLDGAGLEKMVKKCLSGGLSDADILRTAKKFLHV